MGSLTSGSSVPPAVHFGAAGGNQSGKLPAMEYTHLRAEDKARFWDDGFLVKRRYFDDEEVGIRPPGVGRGRDAARQRHRPAQGLRRT